MVVERSQALGVRVSRTHHDGSIDSKRVSKKLVLDGRDGVFSGAWNPDNFIRPI
jgi:hypothetical protein